MRKFNPLNYRFVFVCFVVFEAIISTCVMADEDTYQQVIIAEPFIEFHTGPGFGYPIFYIVEKGEKIILIKKRTQWYKVATITGASGRSQTGWVHESKLAKTLTLDDETFKIENPELQGFINRDFDAGVLAGDFGGSTVMTLFTGWNWTPNITTELAFSQAIGNVSDSQLIDLSIMHQPFPEWQFSPYVKLGGGAITTEAHTTLVSTDDRKDEFIHAGLGFRIYISHQFSARVEYNSYTILTSRNDNNQVEEWKLGFSVFF